jgi:hypothetical protein
MSLDLDEIIGDWDCPDGELCARLIQSAAGPAELQLRVDLGLLQMGLDDRPDGTCYQGMATAIEYVARELQADRNPHERDWQELAREIAQLNFRRLGLANIAEQALRRQDDRAAATYLRRALRDIERCLAGVQMMEEALGGAGEHSRLKPTLVFNRARLGAQLAVACGDYDAAIEATDIGADQLDALLTAAGLDPDQRNEDAGIVYLRELSQRLRNDYNIPLTLRERLEAAIAADDFETAAELHEELRRREPHELDDSAAA